MIAAIRPIYLPCFLAMNKAHFAMGPERIIFFEKTVEFIPERGNQYGLFLYT